MVKKFIVLFIGLTTLWSSDLFEKECLTCHIQRGVDFEPIFRRYLLLYSTHEERAGAIFDYLKNPNAKSSAMPPGYLKRFGIKDKSTLNDEDLKKAIEQFQERYNIAKRLR